METRLFKRRRFVVFSDLHQSEGPAFPDGRPNHREDFTADEIYIRMSKAILRDLGEDEGLTLVYDGDVIDYHAIRCRGEFGSVPTVEAALEKTETCLRGHVRFWTHMLSELLRDDRVDLVFIPGNHDFEWVWPEVQELLIRTIDPDQKARDRIRFMNELTIEIEGGKKILIVHGDRFDPPNANPPPERHFISAKSDSKPLLPALIIIALVYGTALGFVNWRRHFTLTNVGLASAGLLASVMIFGWIVRKIYWKWLGKEKKFLNVPYGTIMNSSLGQRLKGISWVGGWIGRMQSHGAVWLLSFARDWRFALFAGPALLGNIIWHRFFADLIDFRRKARGQATLKLLASTWQDVEKIYEREMRKLLAADPDIKYVVTGHTHCLGIQDLKFDDGRNVIYFNTGTAIDQMRLVKPEVKCRTRFVRVESFFRRIGYYWRNKTKLALGLTAAHAVAALAPYVIGRFLRWPPGSVGWTVAGLSAFFLLMRQSYALYRGEIFRRLTPLFIQIGPDLSAKVSLRDYQPETEAFEPYL